MQWTKFYFEKILYSNMNPQEEETLEKILIDLVEYLARKEKQPRAVIKYLKTVSARYDEL